MHLVRVVPVGPLPAVAKERRREEGVLAVARNILRSFP
jgi:hypothetical protein